MNKPAFGLIGIGGFAREHYNTLRYFEKAGRLKLAAVCDPFIGRQPELEAEVRASGVRVYHDHRAMLEKEPGLRAVVVATPILLHEEMILDCLELDLFIYLEKPPVPLASQLHRLVAADRYGQVSVGFQMVDSDWNQRIKSWIAEGRLGEIREIRVVANWPRYDGYYRRASWAGQMVQGGRPVFDGPATNALAHLIHSAMYFGGTERMSFARPVSVQGEMYRVRPIPAYDLMCLRASLPSGATVFAALSHAQQTPTPYRVEVIGAKGWCRVSEKRKMLESSFGTFALGEMPSGMLHDGYESFCQWVCGARARPATLLADAEGYVWTTNAMLASSGDIHTVDPVRYRVCDEAAGRIYDVEGLREALADQRAMLYSERGLSWSVEPATILIEDTAEWRWQMDQRFQAVAKGGPAEQESPADAMTVH